MSHSGNNSTRWVKLLLGILLSLLCLYFVAKDLSWEAVRTAFAGANLLYLFLGLVSIGITLLVKVSRWRLLFYPDEQATPLSTFFRPMMAGQLLNLLPVRIGDLGRMFMLGQARSLANTHVLGTIAIEKSLDLIMFGLSLLILLPLAVLPDIVQINFATTAAITLIAVLILLLLVFQTDRLLIIAKAVTNLFPKNIGTKLYGLVESGLKSATSLQNPKIAFAVFALSLLIPFLHVLTPFIMFRVFNLSLTFIDAAVINLALTIVSTLPGTPGNVGIFEAVVMTTLQFMGIPDGSIRLAYAILFHLVVLLPQLLFGGWALTQFDLSGFDFQRGTPHTTGESV